MTEVTDASSKRARVIEDLQDICSEYESIRLEAGARGIGSVPLRVQAYLAQKIAACISRSAPKNSIYGRQAAKAIADYQSMSARASALAGIAQALKSDLEQGKSGDFEELVHADMFSDFLEMSEYLIEQNYKDAAAVTIGAVLERHLRELCQINDIEISSDNRKKKADRLNSELATADVITKLDQKNVTAWLGLRNHAAHGEYELYSIQEIRILHAGVAQFLQRYPA